MTPRAPRAGETRPPPSIPPPIGTTSRSGTASSLSASSTRASCAWSLIPLTQSPSGVSSVQRRMIASRSTAARSSAMRRLPEERLVLLVLVGARVEGEDRVAVVERVLAVDGHALGRGLDHVVAGLGLAPEARGRHRSGVDDE